MECIFCEIIGGRQPGIFLYRDENVAVFMDRYPIDTGHSLVVSTKHYEKITDMPAHEVGQIFAGVPRIASAILAGVGADAFSIAQNNGRAAKQIVPHVHIHIIPRFNDRGTVWTTRGIPDHATLEKTAEKIRAHLAP